MKSKQKQPKKRLLKDLCDIEIFNTKCKITTSRKAFKKLEKRFNAQNQLLPDTEAAGKCAYIVSKDKHYIIIGVFDNQAVTLTHELFHAVNYIVDTLGIDLRTDDGNELGARIYEKLYEKSIGYIK